MPSSVESKVSLISQDCTQEHDLQEIIRGLSSPRKKLSPKFFYDERGSRLFEAICDLPEYYLTRTEISIMREHMPAIVQCVGPRARVIEFGAGAGLKTRLLLDHLEQPVAFLPVDISGDHLEAVAQTFAREFPDLEILPVAADFMHPFPLPESRREPRRNLVYFPGSTIGNFGPRSAVELLRVMHEEAGEGGALLIGVDLQKDRKTLERAYDDRAGVTAEFNRNMLRRLNREFGADFNLETFRHRAIYNEAAGRIEMHLVSTVTQEVHLGQECFQFERGEALTTEYSYKYSLDGFRELVRQAGFSVQQTWVDSRRWFSIHFCTRD